jgi:hypothetical protein
MTASMLRLPTALRKKLNKQSFFYHNKITDGVILGGIAGFMADVDLLVYSFAAIKHENDYLPAAILLATNLVSGIYELGRLKISREENKEVNRLVDEPIEGEMNG